MLGEALGKKFNDCYQRELLENDDFTIDDFLRRMANIACADLAAAGRPEGLIDIRGHVDQKTEPDGKDIILKVSVMNTRENRLALVELSGPVTITGCQMPLPMGNDEKPTTSESEDPNQMDLESDIEAVEGEATEELELEEIPEEE